MAAEMSLEVVWLAKTLTHELNDLGTSIVNILSCPSTTGATTITSDLSAAHTHRALIAVGAVLDTAGGEQSVEYEFN